MNSQRDNLKGLRVAILVDKGFEKVEMTRPREALEDAGARTTLISPQNPEVRAWNMKDWDEMYPVQKALDEARPDEYDALVLPGGVMNPDQLRANPRAVAFVKSFADQNKPVAAICHGPWTLLETGALNGRTVTSWPSLKTDLKNAGARWEDREVIVDRNFVFSRKPDDIPAFIREMLALFAQCAPQKS